MNSDESGLTSRSNVEQSTSGFPSPAADYLEKPLDLHRLLVRHPAATFFMRARGDGMQGAGIFPDDLLVIDRSLPPENGKIVVAVKTGELRVGRLRRLRDGLCLVSEAGSGFSRCEAAVDEYTIWGVVTQVIHSV